MSTLFQVAENIKEFFHNEGIHSTTIQPEFIDYGQIGAVIHDDCVLVCPKGPTQESSICDASKCCPINIGNGNGNGNGNGKGDSARSTHNTPVAERRSNSFVMDNNVSRSMLNKLDLLVRGSRVVLSTDVMSRENKWKPKRASTWIAFG